jgi:hypothetical protein
MLLNIIGDAYEPSWIMNGIIYLKSRYLTVSADTNTPKPRAEHMAMSKNNGKNNIRAPGRSPPHAIMISKIRKVIKKSIRQTITVLAGIINRGKYTFEIRLVFPTSEFAASLNAPEKNCQGKVAAATNKMREGPGAPILKNHPRKENAIIVVRGRSIIHARPITVCL